MKTIECRENQTALFIDRCAAHEIGRDIRMSVDNWCNRLICHISNENRAREVRRLSVVDLTFCPIEFVKLRKQTNNCKYHCK